MLHIRLMPVLFLLACASAAAADVELSVLSSAPDMVTGGDARIAVKAAPALQDGMTFWLNGAPIAPPMVRTADGMEGLVAGLGNGKNVLELRYRNGAQTLALTNY